VWYSRYFFPSAGAHRKEGSQWASASGLRNGTSAVTRCANLTLGQKLIVKKIIPADFGGGRTLQQHTNNPFIELGWLQVLLGDRGGATEVERRAGGEQYRKINLFITVYYGVYYGLLRILRNFIMEITVPLQGNLFNLKRLSQIRPENPTFGGNQSKSGPFLLRILRNIMDITDFFFDGILRKITVRNVSPHPGERGLQTPGRKICKNPPILYTLCSWKSFNLYVEVYPRSSVGK
jgi:hypothetical protein